MERFKLVKIAVDKRNFNATIRQSTITGIYSIGIMEVDPDNTDYAMFTLVSYEVNGTKANYSKIIDKMIAETTPLNGYEYYTEYAQASIVSNVIATLKSDTLETAYNEALQFLKIQ